MHRRRHRVLRFKSSPESAYASRGPGFPLRPLTHFVQKILHLPYQPHDFRCALYPENHNTIIQQYTAIDGLDFLQYCERKSFSLAQLLNRNQVTPNHFGAKKKCLHFTSSGRPETSCAKERSYSATDRSGMRPAIPVRVPESLVGAYSV
jgi:hypothetical protein